MNAMVRHSLVVLMLVLPTTLPGVEIKGKVIEAKDNSARITTDSELLPNPGDKVEIYFEIAGLDEPVSVASGKVSGPRPT